MTNSLPLLLLALAAIACEKPRATSGITTSPPTPAPSAQTSSIEGVVRVPAPPAREKTALPASVKKVCGDALDDASLELGANGAAKNVVVAIASPPATTTPSTVVVDQRGCAYSPSVQAASVGSTLALLNSDSLLHNVRADQAGNQLFNFAMPLQGMRTEKRLAEAGVVELKCDVHPWMSAWVRVFDHPRFTLTDGEGRFRLDRIPAGKHQLIFWHPRLGEQVVDVSTEPDRSTVRDLIWR